MAKKHSANTKDIIIRNVDPKTKEVMQNIAKNKGVTLASLMRTEIRDIIERSPEGYKSPPLED